MIFKGDKAIYLQIAEHVMENILAETWKAKDRIPSVRDMAVSMEVNPNTVVNAYGYMQEKGIIYNQRGVGYFVAADAVEKVRRLEKEDFFQEQLPGIFKSMRLLDIGMDELAAEYEKFMKEIGREKNEDQ